MGKVCILDECQDHTVGDIVVQMAKAILGGEILADVSFRGALLQCHLLDSGEVSGGG